MDPGVIREALRARPFLPFRLRFTDSREFRVPHPELLAMGPNGRSMAYYNPDEDGRILFLNPLLLVSIEFARVQPPSDGNGTAG
jgi:hypothetical protein